MMISMEEWALKLTKLSYQELHDWGPECWWCWLMENGYEMMMSETSPMICDIRFEVIECKLHTF